MREFFLTGGAVAAAVFVLGLLLALLPHLGRIGRAMSDAFARPPLLDLALAALTCIPWIVCAAIGGWLGLLACLLGQMLALYAWIFVHELIHLRAARGPRIVRFTNRLVGRPSNHLALWLTTVGVPVLWLVRAIEIFIYPTLVWLLRFPKYNHAEWVTLSRHKFRDLVGHDLVWCLYCDWMTGTWSLGTEMLRNVESFWCPIRFEHPKKLEHCASVFPDIDGGWVSADSSMAQVEAVLEKKYGGAGDRSWFGHPARIDRNGHDGNSIPDEMEERCRELLADHSRSPRNHRAMEDATHQAHGELPLCDDRVTVFLRIEDGIVRDASFTGRSCPICTASASMMTELLEGRSEAQCRRLFESFRDLLTRPENGTENELGDLNVLAGVQRLPNRVKCATLPWHAMMAAMKNAVPAAR